MPRIDATTIKARVTIRFIRLPRLNEMTPHSAAGARCSTVFLALETARYPTKSPVVPQAAKDTTFGCD
jgi:hypothetical protein